MSHKLPPGTSIMRMIIDNPWGLTERKLSDKLVKAARELPLDETDKLAKRVHRITVGMKPQFSAYSFEDVDWYSIACYLQTMRRANIKPNPVNP